MRKALAGEELIKMHGIHTGRRGGQIKVTEITDKGHELLKKYKVSVKKTAGRGGFEHRWWQGVICEFFEKRGFKARVEQEVAGKAVDVGVIRGGRGVAIEVVMRGSHEKEMSNVAKDMEAWDEVWLCAVRMETLDGLRGKVLEAFGQGLLDSRRVRFVRLSEFLKKGARNNELNAQ